MNHSDPKTVEQVLFERMGVSVEDLVAAGTDYVDEEAVRAADAGIEIDHRLSGLGTLIEKLTEPDTVSALLELLDRLLLEQDGDREDRRDRDHADREHADRDQHLDEAEAGLVSQAFAENGLEGLGVHGFTGSLSAGGSRCIG